MSEAKPASGCTGPSDCCAVPIMGNHTDTPVGELRLQTDIASVMAQVSYELGTAYSIIPTIRVDGCKATLVSVRIQHNSVLDRSRLPNSEKT